MVVYERQRVFVTVAAVSFSTIMLELIIARMSVFYIAYINSVIAIPITLFGLALGSIHACLNKRLRERFSMQTDVVRLLAFSTASFLAAFIVFSQVFSIQHYYGVEYFWVLTLKTVLFIILFIMPFYMAGKMLSIVYTMYRDRIGIAYGYDLLGASIAALLTPLLLHFLDMTQVIAVHCLVLSFTALLWTASTRKKTVIIVLLLIAFNIVFYQGIAWLESSYDFTILFGDESTLSVEEIAHRWNEYSRVSIIRKTTDRGRQYLMTHDNGESNVNIEAFNPSNPKPLGYYRETIQIAYLFKNMSKSRNITDAFVMFAGCGAQMIQFYDYSEGHVNITGVELNPAVTDLAVNTPELSSFMLKEFYEQPNVRLMISEGRAFMQQDKNKYDIIYVASDAPTNEYLTGHSRKYLDTMESMEQYLKHLKQGGILIFESQEVENKIGLLRKIADHGGLKSLEDSIAILEYRGRNTLFVSPSGFQDNEVEILSTYPKNNPKYIVMGMRLAYAPRYPGNEKRYIDLIAKPPHMIPTDDRPFIEYLDFNDFRFFPDRHMLASHPYYKNWIRIFTLFLVLSLVVAIITGLYVLSKHTPPLYITIYLMLTGFGYMLLEVSLMGRLELLIGDPLSTMSLLLCGFLVTNSIGSTLYSRIKNRIDMRFITPFMAAIVIATIFLSDHAINTFLSESFMVRMLCSLMLVIPAGICLGLFYPYAVSVLSNEGRIDAIPLTYGISTLSSVAGATYAMIMSMNYGYTGIMIHAIAVYALLAVLTAFARQ
jgi:hypothetical protein